MVQDYMERAADDIRLLETRKQAVRSLRARIRMVEADAVSLSGAGTSAAPVRGGGNRQEQRLIGMIGRKEKLEKQERAMRDMVTQTERALYKLTADERQVLLWFYLPGRIAVRQMQERLHMSRAGVYRFRDRALEKFAGMMGYRA